MAGFGVFQPALGAALQFLPALGTPELDEMIHAVFPGPASIQDKRTNITMDFFEYSQQTGQNFKFYPVPTSFTSVTAASPASSAGLYDSAYGSTFNASPVVSSMSPWPQSPATFTSSFSDEPKTKSHATPSRKPTASSSRQATTDFASHPGMRIMTKDGRDVTNSASRGCKTKEQRDHAHLMRIIKACDSCKRKKIRCDPSHKKRTPSSSQPEPKPAKKMKKATESPPAPPKLTPEYFASGMFEAPEAASSFESSPETVDDLWSQFVLFDQEPLALADNFIADDYDFFHGPQGFLTPSSSNSSTSPSQWFTPFTPAPPGPSPPVFAAELLSYDTTSPGAISSDLLADTAPHDLTVPYLNPGIAHGTNYVDFNLYSPPADFFLDEEPLPAKKALVSGGNHQSPPQPTTVYYGLDVQQTISPRTTVVASSDEYYSSPSPSTTSDVDQRQSILRHPDLGQQTSEAIIASPGGVGVYAGDPVRDGHSLSLSAVRDTPQSQSGQHERTRARLDDHSTSSEVKDRQTLATERRSVSYCGQTTVAATGLGAQESPSSSQASSQAKDPADHHDPRSTASPSAQPALAASAGGSVYGRPLSVGQQLQTLSTHSTAAQTPTQSPELVVTGVAQRSGAGTSRNVAQRCGSTASSLLTVRLNSEASPVLGEQSGAGVFFVDSGVILATALIATSPMQRLPVGGGQKNGQQTALSSLALFRLVVLGLVSSLLAIALQNQISELQVDFRVFLDVLIIASISCASLLQYSSRLPETTVKPLGTSNSVRHPTPTPNPVSIIDSVKTKIHTFGQRINNLRCASSQPLRAIALRLSVLTSVKF